MSLKLDLRGDFYKCVEKEVENLKNMATKVVVKEHRNGKQVWTYGLCLIDYEIRELREK